MANSEHDVEAFLLGADATLRSQLERWLRTIAHQLPIAQAARDIEASGTGKASTALNRLTDLRSPVPDAFARGVAYVSNAKEPQRLVCVLEVLRVELRELDSLLQRDHPGLHPAWPDLSASESNLVVPPGIENFDKLAESVANLKSGSAMVIASAAGGGRSTVLRVLADRHLGRWVEDSKSIAAPDAEDPVDLQREPAPELLLLDPATAAEAKSAIEQARRVGVALVVTSLSSWSLPCTKSIRLQPWGAKELERLAAIVAEHPGGARLVENMSDFWPRLASLMHWSARDAGYLLRAVADLDVTENAGLAEIGSALLRTRLQGCGELGTVDAGMLEEVFVELTKDWWKGGCQALTEADFKQTIRQMADAPYPIGNRVVRACVRSHIDRALDALGCMGTKGKSVKQLGLEAKRALQRARSATDAPKPNDVRRALERARLVFFEHDRVQLEETVASLLVAEWLEPTEIFERAGDSYAEIAVLAVARELPNAATFIHEIVEADDASTLLGLRAALAVVSRNPAHIPSEHMALVTASAARLATHPTPRRFLDAMMIADVQDLHAASRRCGISADSDIRLLPVVQRFLDARQRGRADDGDEADARARRMAELLPWQHVDHVLDQRDVLSLYPQTEHMLFRDLLDEGHPRAVMIATGVECHHLSRMLPLDERLRLLDIHPPLGSRKVDAVLECLRQSSAQEMEKHAVRALTACLKDSSELPTLAPHQPVWSYWLEALSAAGRVEVLRAKFRVSKQHLELSLEQAGAGCAGADSPGERVIHIGRLLAEHGEFEPLREVASLEHTFPLRPGDSADEFAACILQGAAEALVQTRDSEWWAECLSQASTQPDTITGAINVRCDDVGDAVWLAELGSQVAIRKVLDKLEQPRFRALAQKWAGDLSSDLGWWAAWRLLGAKSEADVDVLLPWITEHASLGLALPGLGHPAQVIRRASITWLDRRVDEAYASSPPISAVFGQDARDTGMTRTLLSALNELDDPGAEELLDRLIVLCAKPDAAYALSDWDHGASEVVRSMLHDITRVSRILARVAEVWAEGIAKSLAHDLPHEVWQVPELARWFPGLHQKRDPVAPERVLEGLTDMILEHRESAWPMLDAWPMVFRELSSEQIHAHVIQRCRGASAGGNRPGALRLAERLIDLDLGMARAALDVVLNEQEDAQGGAR